MLDELDAPLRSADWPAALAIALDAWREHRAPELASLIDAIAAKLPAVPAPKPAEVHGWWMTLAEPYDPLAAGALVDHANTRITGSDIDRVPRVPQGRTGARELGAAIQAIASAASRIDHANALDRLGAILTWPDDPRASTILAGWLLDAPVRWDALVSGRATLHFYGSIADRLKTLADARIVARLAECEQTPRGPTATIRQQQRILARQVREATETVARKKAKQARAVAKRAVELAALLPTREAPPPPRDRTVDEDAMWSECAKHPGDHGPRLVLADVLAERGESRGELIALQLAGTPKAAAQAKKLARAQWNLWLGDLALVLNKSGTEFIGGMLEVARVGTPKSPEWAFTKVHGHRELATVRVVRPGHVQPQHYAEFLASPNLSPETVGFDAPEIIDCLLRSRRRWSFRAVEYGHHAIRSPYRYQFPPLDITFTRLAALVPDLEELHVAPLQWPQDALAQLRAVVPKLPEQFRSLKAIVLDSQWLAIEPAFAAMPLVTAAT